ncbi:MAG: glycosyltransferase family 4 protein [Deltaproteobacteria bacterium]|nr:glycosyltransferase family 4 protein [Deltaproteobacteria bacterium]
MTADCAGGVWTYSLELARAIGAHGARVTLALMGPPLTEDKKEDAARIPDLEVLEGGFKLEWMEDPWDDVRKAGEWLLSVEERLRPDVVHLNGFCHGGLGWKSPKLIAAHSCVVSWWEAVHGKALPPEWDRYRREAGNGLNGADAIVAPTNAMLSSLYRNYFIRPFCAVLPNGRSGEPFGPGKKEEMVFTMGRLWDEAKNVSAIAEIAHLIPWPVYAAGEGGERMGSALKRLGPLPARSVAGYLSRAKIYAHPALYEPFGLSVLEAGLSGCALVISDIPSLRELWDGAAVFVPPRNSGALAVAINRLIRSPLLLREAAQKARARALEYDTARMAEGYMEIYKGLASGRFKPERPVKEGRCAL